MTEFWRQFLAILPVYVLQFCYGMSGAYPSVTTPELTMDCALFSITPNQESNIGKTNPFLGVFIYPFFWMWFRPLPVLLILGLQEYSWKSYTTFAGVLPQKWHSASRSTPKLKKHGTVPLLQELSHKSGIVLPGVLPNKLKLYTGGDLDMICNLDILLPMDTLSTFILGFWENSQ